MNVAKAQARTSSAVQLSNDVVQSGEKLGFSEEGKRRRREEMNEESERKEQKERNRMSAQRSRHRKRFESDSLRQESNKVSVTCASI